MATFGHTVDRTVADIVALYSSRGGTDYIGEPVTQLQHAAQAAGFARSVGADDEFACAAFLHDIGHLVGAARPHAQMDGFGVAEHERIGAAYLLSRGFSERVVRLVGGHVDAKRYLTYAQPDYFARLSAASKRTLEFQGGPMKAAEARAFERDAAFDDILRLRRCDEAAKVADLTVLPLQRFGGLLRAHLEARAAAPISDAQTSFWKSHGYLHVDGALDPNACAELAAWVDDLAARPESPGRWMKYFEPIGGERRLCRVENFIQYHAGLDRLIAGPRTLAMVGALLGEPAALFKEKINFKLAGGAGFAPHQDAPAFTSFGQSLHITLMISVDATTPENGCLDIAPHPGDRLALRTAPDLTLAPDVTDSLAWTPLPTSPGDVVFFDSFLPHRSGPNRTAQPRRALYVTYNKAAEGNVREAYYREKRAVFPPDVERIPGKDYGDSGVFNVGNPIE
ncbi:MAG TPA: phytanoyl-CoA dioxygenase family protein [Pseudomonadales bacterium]|nr:phytanoyl-CoA dioxygenase family protein [Pseudomonadales bacterium]